MKKQEKTARVTPTKNPLISILLQCHNDGKYLCECLDSILKQTYDNIEIVLHDFASTDNSLKIALEYQKKNPGIITIINFCENLYITRNITTSRNIRGSLFMRFDACGSMAPVFLEKCVNIFKQNPDVFFVRSNKTIINNDGNAIPSAPLYEKSCIVHGLQYIPSLLKYSSSKNLPYSIFRQDAKKHINSDSLEYYTSLHGSMAYLKEPLITCRYPQWIRIPDINGDLCNIYQSINFKYNAIKSLVIKNEINNASDIIPKLCTKLSRECLDYSVDCVTAGKNSEAKQFFHLAAAIDIDIEENEAFQLISKYWETKDSEKKTILEELKSSPKNSCDITLPVPKGSTIL